MELERGLGLAIGKPARSDERTPTRSSICIRPDGCSALAAALTRLTGLHSLSVRCCRAPCTHNSVYTAEKKWRPPRHLGALIQEGEFDGFPGLRERLNQSLHATLVSGLVTYPTLGRNRRRRKAPSDPSLYQPCRQSLAACPELEQNFHQPQKEPQP
jgi:hypothetical protein